MNVLYLIGGTMGVGKTTAAEALRARLPDSLWLDGDWCWMMKPFDPTDAMKKMVMDNITDVMTRFLKSERQAVIFSWVMHQQAIIDELLRRWPTQNYKIVAVSLVAPEDELERRMRIRGDSEAAIERSKARLPLYDALNTVQIDVSGLTPAETAIQIELAGQNTHRMVMDSPVGPLAFTDNGHAITAIEAAPRESVSPLRTPIGRQAEAELREYFAGKRTAFTFPTRIAGTEYQKRVWATVRDIPYGETCTYGELAEAIGSKLARPIGIALHRNPLLIVTPCHRVIGANGDLIGYSAGLEIKQRLLEFERNMIRHRIRP